MATRQQQKVIKVVCDDGSTQVKMAWFDEKGRIQTRVFSSKMINGARKTMGIYDKSAFNLDKEGLVSYTIDGSANEPIKSNYVEYQYEDRARVPVMNALMQAGFAGKTIDLIVTLPISEYYCRNMEKNVERKGKNLRGMCEPVLQQKDHTPPTIRSISVFPEGLPAIIALTRKFKTVDGKRVVAFESGFEHDSIVAVIDIGGTTTDIGAFTVGNYVARRDATCLSVGTERVVDDLMSVYHYSYDKAQKLVRGSITDKESLAQLKEVKTATFPLIKTEILRSLGGDQYMKNNFDAVFFVGGGSLLFKDEILQAYPFKNVRVVDDLAVEAIAKGALLIA